MNMSKAMRLQLIGIRLCEAVRDACAEAYRVAGIEMPPEKVRALAELRRQEQAAFKFATGGRVNDDGQMELDPKAMGQYAAAIKRLQDMLTANYDDTVDARSFLTLATLWVEDVRQGNEEAGIKPMPKTPVDRWLTWRRMAELIEEIKGMYPEDEAQVDHGHELGEVIVRVVA